MSSVLQPKTYGVQVGDMWVSIDFEAKAISVTRGRHVRSAHTENKGGGFLIDYAADWTVVGVEILASNQDDTPAKRSS